MMRFEDFGHFCRIKENDRIIEGEGVVV